MARASKSRAAQTNSPFRHERTQPPLARHRTTCPRFARASGSPRHLAHHPSRLPQNRYRPINAAPDAAARSWNSARHLILSGLQPAMPTSGPHLVLRSRPSARANPSPWSGAGDNARTNSRARTNEPKRSRHGRTARTISRPCRSDLERRPAKTNPEAPDRTALWSKLTLRPMAANVLIGI